eukprot:COSAG01_NODE_12108_length_1799_cov_19.130588_2_plen_318_part_00
MELALAAAQQGGAILAQLTTCLRMANSRAAKVERPTDISYMKFSVKEQREHSLRVFAAEASAWLQLLVAQGSENLQLRKQIAAAQAEVTQLKQAKRQELLAQLCPETRVGSDQQLKGQPRQRVKSGSEQQLAGLAQGLGFLRTRRVDLSGESFGDVDPEQALAIATACGSELDALFLPVPLALPPEVVAQLRETCPQARCLVLGGEVTEVGFEEILRQCTTPDAELADALGLAAATIAEGVPPPPSASSAPDLEPEPEDPAELEPEPEDAPSPAAVAGGTPECYYTLDLTDPAQFQHLTDAGLGAFTACAFHRLICM